MHCEIGGTQGPLGYVSALGATRLVHWLILVAPSCLRSHNARYIMLKSLNTALYPCKANHGMFVFRAVMMTSSNGNIFRVTGPLCGEFTGPSEFPTQRPVTRSFDVFFDLRLNKRLSKQPWVWSFETQPQSLWRHCNGKTIWDSGSLATDFNNTMRTGEGNVWSVVPKNRY